MVVSIDYSLEGDSGGTNFLIDTKKLKEIENFRETYNSDLSDEELKRVDEARKKIKKKLETEEDIIGWGFNEEMSCEGFRFHELIEGTKEEYPIRVMKNITVLEE